jgi:DNA anti-recombination protein RmuC
MASPESPDPREWRQMRNDVDDGYELLKRVQESVIKVSATQRLHGNRLEEIQQTLDIHSGRLDRMEDNQRRQGDRLGRIELLQSEQGDRLGRVEGRLDGVDERLGRMEKTQEQILDLLRGRPTG